MSRLASIAILFVATLSAGCANWASISPLARLENRLVYQPAPFPADFPFDEVPFEDVVFASSDGTGLHGWFVDHPDPVAIALICHGNAGNIASRGESLMILNRRHRLAVMIFDYRGYGRSEGVPGEAGIVADARAARAWLAKRKNVAEEEIVLMPVVPANLLMRQRFNSIEKIRNYHGPLLQSHGDADQLIPIDQGRQLFAAAPGQKTFVTIANAGHNDPQSEEYRQALDRFLAQIGN